VVIRLLGSFCLIVLTAFRADATIDCREYIRLAVKHSPVSRSLTERASAILLRLDSELTQLETNPQRFAQASRDPQLRVKYHLVQDLRELRAMLDEIKVAEGILSEAGALDQAYWKAELSKAADSFHDKSKIVISKLMNLYVPSSDEIFVTIRFPRTYKQMGRAPSDNSGNYIVDAYTRFVNSRKADGWSLDEVIYERDDEGGPTSSVTLRISGKRVEHFFKYEAGEHSIEFLDEGRVYTNIVAVSVLPVDGNQTLRFPDKDFEEQTTNSGGPGGQNVNKVQTAVMVRHIPSGEFVKVQVHRSQAMNRMLAYKLLRARLATIEQEKKDAAKLSLVRQQIGFSRGEGQKVRRYDLVENVIRDAQTKAKYGLADFENGRLDLYVSERQLDELERVLSD